MKRAKFIFPLMFILALAGSAFTRQAGASARSMTAYYEDIHWNTCKTWLLSDGKCIVDPVGYVCKEYVSGYGLAAMLQYKSGSTCIQPYYSYTP